jgi:hypothetical protein
MGGDPGDSDMYSMDGYVDSLRISNTARYTSAFTVPSAAFEDDQYTRLLLNFVGSNASTTFTDSSGGSGGRHTITANGDVTNTRAVRKIGDSSIKFDGTGDYLSIPNSSDFDFGSGALTIECWARFPSVPTGGGTYGLFNYATSSGSSVGGSGWNMDLEDISGTLNLRWQFWDDGTPSNRTGHQPWTPSSQNCQRRLSVPLISSKSIFHPEPPTLEPLEVA